MLRRRPVRPNGPAPRRPAGWSGGACGRDVWPADPAVPNAHRWIATHTGRPTGTVTIPGVDEHGLVRGAGGEAQARLGVHRRP
jgi:hypothetical protein